jgi:hypothetical protein
MPEFSHGHTDRSLTTDAANIDASRTWEGQLRPLLNDGNLCFLFVNKGSLFHGHGFEMLTTLIQHCRPDLVSNEFTSLLSLFNDIQGEGGEILE